MKGTTRNAKKAQCQGSLLSSAVTSALVLLWSLNLLSCSGAGVGFFRGHSSGDDELGEGSTKEPGTVSLHVQQAARMYEDERFGEAVAKIEAALKNLPDVPANAILREKLLSMHRLAKAKALIATYHEKLDEIQKASSKSKSIDGLVITQTYGTVWRSENGKQTHVRVGEGVPAETTFFVRSESGLEITSEEEGMVRSVDASNFSFPGSGHIVLNKGSILVHLSKDTDAFRIEAPLVEVNLSSNKASTVLVSVTTSGGLKIIANQRELVLRLANKKELKLKAGELVFVLPDPQGFSRKMDVELSTILMTADLLTGFQEPVPFSRSLRMSASMQARRIKGRFRAVVGDVKTDDKFQVKVIDEEDQDAKQDPGPKKKGALSRFFQGFFNRDKNE